MMESERSGAARSRARRGTARALPIALTVAGLIACTDGPIDPQPIGPSRVSLSYSGPLSGTLVAEGELQPGQQMLGSTYARGLRYSSPAAIEITGNKYDADTNLVDWIAVDVPAARTGTFQIDASGCPPWQDECAGVSLILRLLNQNGQQARYSCTLLSGTITVSAVSSTRATGTFSGSGECLDRDDVGGEAPQVSITAGKFDVKLSGGSR